MSARAVLFDLDDTLFDHRGCSRDALASVQNSHHALGAMALDDLETAHSRVLEELHAEVMLGRVPLEQARLERFRRLIAMSGGTPPDEAVARTAATYRDRYKEVRRAVRGARDLLQALSNRARIGIVSNNLFDEQREKLEHCGLAGFIDALVVSERVGVSKPDPAIFVAALEALQCDAAETVMVGRLVGGGYCRRSRSGHPADLVQSARGKVSGRRTSRGTPIARTGGRRRRADPRALGSDGGVETGGGDAEV